MIDSKAVGEAFYNFGYSLGEAINHAIEAINSVDWSALAEIAYQLQHKDSYRKHPRIEITREEYYEKSNNWLRMHGYHSRRRM